MDFYYSNADLEYLDRVQAIALKIYGRYDLEKSLIWMMEEFGELIKSIHKGEAISQVQGELGDLMAWVLCIANIMGISLSESVCDTFKKEISRQLLVYNRLKYTDELDGFEFV